MLLKVSPTQDLCMTQFVTTLKACIAFINCTYVCDVFFLADNILLSIRIFLWPYT